MINILFIPTLCLKLRETGPWSLIESSLKKNKGKEAYSYGPSPEIITYIRYWDTHVSRKVYFILPLVLWRIRRNKIV